MKFLLVRNPTGYFEVQPLKDDGMPDYERAWIVPLEKFPIVARMLGFNGSMIPADAGKCGIEKTITDFLNSKIGSKFEQEDHDVRFDCAGHGQYPRYTCYTRGHKGIDGNVDDICGTTCLRQPWMKEADWQAKKAEWFALHPCPKDKIRPA